MTNERRFSYWRQIRHAAVQLGRGAYLLLRQGALVAWCLGSCLMLTIRVVLRIAWWTICFLTPVPERVGTSGRRRPTGLAIPAFDVMVILFGAATLIGYVW